MKFCKKGFSLAEILIALAIVSVIATACFSVAKRGVERAYDGYIYTGVKGLSDAIRYANAQTFEDESGNLQNLSVVNNPIDFLRQINSALGGTITATPPYIIRTLNNIEYEFQNPVGNTCSLIMRVPSPRKSNSSKTDYNLTYVFLDDFEIIIPDEDLENRIDLLPYYVDNGRVGRINPHEAEGNRYEAVNYLSFREAFCRAHGSLGEIYPATKCQGISRDLSGSIVLVNPRKLRPF